MTDLLSYPGTGSTPGVEGHRGDFGGSDRGGFLQVEKKTTYCHPPQGRLSTGLGGHDPDR